MAETAKAPFTSIEEIARLYPLLFSQKRLDEWMDLFDKRASIVRVEQGKALSCLSILDAMPEQREYAKENEKFNEQWENIDIKTFGNIAVIKADYTLTTCNEIRKGTDVLTLTRNNDGWLITNLTYEQTEYIPR